MKIPVLTAMVLMVAAAPTKAQSLESLMQNCASNVHPSTMSAIIGAESNGNANVLADAGIKGLPWAERKKTVRSLTPANATEAEQIATNLIREGHIVAIGLTQVSSQNLAKFGLTVRQALDPCINLKTGAKILAKFYENALPRYRDSNDALLAAISAYNTGNFQDGLTNGYVDSVLRASHLPVPALRERARRFSSPVRASSSEDSMLLSKKFTIVKVTINQ
jgi:type IV secretion system protein VirB1